MWKNPWSICRSDFTEYILYEMTNDKQWLFRMYTLRSDQYEWVTSQNIYFTKWAFQMFFSWSNTLEQVLHWNDFFLKDLSNVGSCVCGNKNSSHKYCIAMFLFQKVLCSIPFTQVWHWNGISSNELYCYTFLDDMLNISKVLFSVYSLDVYYQVYLKIESLPTKCCTEMAFL